MTASETRIRALIHLLSDRDERIARVIHGQLVQIGLPALPYLQQTERHDPELAARLAAIEDAIRFNEILEEFRQVAMAPNTDRALETGVLLIAKTAYPDLDIASYTRRLDEMADDLRARLADDLFIEDSLHVLNQYLFEEQRFAGNREDYYDPDNSFLNRVIDRRTGIPITLSVLYLLIGHRLGLPLAGVNVPGHFMLTVDGHHPPIYIDCFNGGQLLTEDDCASFLRDVGIGFHERFLRPSSHGQILARMLRNLIGIYQNHYRHEYVHRLHALMALVDAQ